MPNELPIEFFEAIAREVKKKKAKKITKKLKPKPPAKARELLPPIYKRVLPPLPPPPKLTAVWPMPPPRPPARPPEAEAAAPPTAPVPTPFPPAPPPLQQAPRPVIIRPAPAPPAPPSAAAKIELGKLNPLIADETITTIQCDGANLPLKIVKERRLEEISVVLSEEEIKGIIKAFSDASGEPITEPMFKTSVAGLTLLAQISAFAGCKFVIKRG